MHSNFHLNLLKPFVENEEEQFPLWEPPKPPPLISEDNQYTVERLLDYKDKRQGQRKRREYLVSWMGYRQEDDSWVAEEDIHEDLVTEYWARVEREGTD